LQATKRDALRPVLPMSAAGIAAVAIATATAVTAAMAAAAAVTVAAVAAAADQDDNDHEPQAGTIVVSVVKAHNNHLALQHSMQGALFWSLTMRGAMKIF